MEYAIYIPVYFLDMTTGKGPVIGAFCVHAKSYDEATPDTPVSSFFHLKGIDPILSGVVELMMNLTTWSKLSTYVRDTQSPHSSLQFGPGWILEYPKEMSDVIDHFREYEHIPRPNVVMN